MDRRIEKSRRKTLPFEARAADLEVEAHGGRDEDVDGRGERQAEGQHPLCACDVDQDRGQHTTRHGTAWEGPRGGLQVRTPIWTVKPPKLLMWALGKVANRLQTERASGGGKAGETASHFHGADCDVETSSAILVAVDARARETHRTRQLSTREAVNPSISALHPNPREKIPTHRDA